MGTEYRSVDVALNPPFYVDVPEGTYDVDAQGPQGERIPPARYAVRAIRHLVSEQPLTTTEQGEQVLHSADIWYWIEVGEGRRWVRAFACVPAEDQGDQ